METTVLNDNIADFYAGKCVFITGGTGFLGKVLIEKLLYSCPDIDKVFMLIREKKGLDISERIKHLFDNPLFDRLKEKRPQNLEKLIPIVGDMNSLCLGLSFENEKTLLEKVSIVIHGAATIKFNEPLRNAWRTNVEGTKMTLNLAQRMKRIEVFVHISTAYTNIDRTVVEEVLYPAPADIDEVYKLVKENPTEKDTSKILGKHPNTYSFTKALTEHLVAENLVHMPTIIIRPSVVTAIKNGPVKGWLDNWFGGTGFMSFIAKGVNRGIYGKESNIMDLIPVDYVINVVIASAAKNCRSKELKIYNCCSSSCNPLFSGKLVKTFVEETKKHESYCLPFSRWYIFTRKNWLMYIITLVFQVIPAYIADSFRLLAGRQPKYVKLQTRVIQTRRAIKFFSDNSWILKADRTRELFSSLSDSDKKIFPCDPATIDWNEYLRDYARGVPLFLENKK